MAEESSSVDAAHDRQVPDELVKKLHQATENFHRAKQAIDAAMAGSENAHQETVDKATDQLRSAEREMEEISGKIQGALKR